MDQEMKERQDAQTRARVGQQAAATAMQAGLSKQAERIQNPDYQDAIEDPDVDSEVHSGLEDEFPTWFSGARTRGNRDPSHEQYASLRNTVEAKRRIVERRPGELVANDPFLLAVEQGVGRDPSNPTQPDDSQLRMPMSSGERRVVRGAAEIVTNLDSLSVEGRGIDATSSVTTESRVVDNQEEERSSYAQSASELFR